MLTVNVRYFVIIKIYIKLLDNVLKNKIPYTKRVNVFQHPSGIYIMYYIFVLTNPTFSVCFTFSVCLAYKELILPSPAGEDDNRHM